ncbi:MAG: hypothetical protein JXA20_09665 [Spirochaetes bacterium]|nr:hypothetical protein [Spirochaetota bacterium]
MFFRDFIEKRQRVLGEVLRRELAMPRGNGDMIDAMVDIIFGVMWYRLIFGHRPLDRGMAALLSDYVGRIGRGR